MVMQGYYDVAPDGTLVFVPGPRGYTAPAQVREEEALVLEAALATPKVSDPVAELVEEIVVGDTLGGLLGNTLDASAMEALLGAARDGSFNTDGICDIHRFLPDAIGIFLSGICRLVTPLDDIERVVQKGFDAFGVFVQAERKIAVYLRGKLLYAAAPEIIEGMLRGMKRNMRDQLRMLVA